ncbi:MAG: hypothetical protein Q4G03_10070 [Planctomycetia bacterium]|nr:hypothetical protein [Planctomycetia bacterium]
MIFKLSVEKTKRARLVVATVALTSLALLIALENSALCQPPQNNNSAQQGGRSSRERGRDRGADRGGNRPAQGQNQPGRPGQGQPGQNQPGQQGQPNAPAQQRPERKVSLEDALERANKTVPITLNQDNFTASDGAKLTGVYYVGNADKDTPVAIILIGVNETPEQYANLAVELAKNGCGVLIPNPRGYNPQGAALNQRSGQGQPGQWQWPGQNQPRWQGQWLDPQQNPGQGQGPQGPGQGQAQGQGAGQNPDQGQTQKPAANQKQQPFAKPSNDDVRKMIEYDYSLWFNFIAYLNNKEKCNRKKTILIGSGFGAALASAWAKTDWELKESEGQNVIGVALISPDAVDAKAKSKDKDKEQEAASKYNVLNSLEGLHRRVKGKTMGFVVFVGMQQSEKLEEAKLIQTKIGGKKEEELPPEEKTVPIVALATAKQGADLLAIEEFAIPLTMTQFIAKRMKEIPTKRNKWEEVKGL